MNQNFPFHFHYINFVWKSLTGNGIENVYRPIDIFAIFMNILLVFSDSFAIIIIEINAEKRKRAEFGDYLGISMNRTI